MFTGIVKGLCKVMVVEPHPAIDPEMIRYAVALPIEWMQGLETGASVSIDGVCQTVTSIDNGLVWFDAIGETLQRTTLKHVKAGQLVNFERAARFGDEIGGHMLSGHIYGTVSIHRIEKSDNNYIVFFQCPPEWTKYLLPKGYAALDGASLTLVDVDPAGYFSVHLIPETLRLTTFGIKKQGDLVNLEFDSQTQAIVDTVERVLQHLTK